MRGGFLNSIWRASMYFEQSSFCAAIRSAFAGIAIATRMSYPHRFSILERTPGRSGTSALALYAHTYEPFELIAGVAGYRLSKTRCVVVRTISWLRNINPTLW